MSKARPYRTIDEVLEELGVPNKQRFRLREATREIVDQHRAKDPEQMKLYLVGDVLPLPLASEFLMKHGGMIFNNKGELRWEGPKDFDVLRTGFAHIIGRQNIQRQEKLTREGSAPQKRPRQDNEDGTAGSTTSERVLKLQRRDAVANPLRGTTEIHADPTEMNNDQSPEFVGSPELPCRTLASRPNPLSKNSLWSISDSSLGGDVATTDRDVDTASQAQFNNPNYEGSRGSTLLPETPNDTNDSRSATNSWIQQHVNDQSRLPDIPPTTATSEQGGRLTISIATENAVKKELFTIQCGDVTHQISGQLCARMIRLTMLHLDSLKADLALAAEQETPFDCQARVSQIIQALENRMKQ